MKMAPLSINSLRRCSRQVRNGSLEGTPRFPTATFWREKASLSPFQRSLRSLPPLRGLRPATKGAFPLGTSAPLLRKHAKLVRFEPATLRPLPETLTGFRSLLDSQGGLGGLM